MTRDAPVAPLGSEAGAIAAIIAPKQLPSTQAFLPPPETSKRLSKASDQSHRVEGAKGKEAQALPKAKDLEAELGKEAAPKKMESEPAKPQAIAQEKKVGLGKTADPPISHPANKKENPSPAKA